MKSPKDANIIPLEKAHKTESHKQKKIKDIKQAFERYLPMKKTKKSTAKNNKGKKK